MRYFEGDWFSDRTDADQLEAEVLASLLQTSSMSFEAPEPRRGTTPSGDLLLPWRQWHPTGGVQWIELVRAGARSRYPEFFDGPADNLYRIWFHTPELDNPNKPFLIGGKTSEDLRNYPLYIGETSKSIYGRMTEGGTAHFAKFRPGSLEEQGPESAQDELRLYLDALITHYKKGNKSETEARRRVSERLYLQMYNIGPLTGRPGSGAFSRRRVAYESRLALRERPLFQGNGMEGLPDPWP